VLGRAWGAATRSDYPGAARPQSNRRSGSAFGRHRTFEDVATASDRSDRQAERLDPTPQPQDMHVKGVAPRRATRPPGTRERLSTDDAAEAVHQDGDQPGLDGRHRRPDVAEAQHAVVVEGRAARGVTPYPSRQTPQSDRKISLAGRDPDPVLKAVSRHRRISLTLHDQQSRPGLGDQAVPPISFIGPAHQHYVHDRDVTVRLLLPCFRSMKEPQGLPTPGGTPATRRLHRARQTRKGWVTVTTAE
jgi:hypothetical protein